MHYQQKDILSCRVQLEFPAQTPVDVHTHLSTILTELALAQAEKGGETHETGDMSVPGIDHEAG